VIELESIKKDYTLNGQKVAILKGISLFVGKGEFVSIMGPSGSGKSTLSAILGCLSTPSEGSYRINGAEVTSLDANTLARLRNESIGFIFQDFNLLSGLNALENVALPLVYSGASTKIRKDRALECLRSVGLETKAFNKPNQLSGGQKQRVAIARALVNAPKFLFADEPTGALDKKTGNEILGIMQHLNMQGQTVIQVTHSPVDAAYSKRILHLVDGNIVRDEMVEKPLFALSTKEEGLEKNDFATKIWRIAQFSPTNNPDDIDAIQRLMEISSSRDSWMAAARAIVRWQHPKALKIMEQLFTSNDWVVRSEIIKYFSLRGRGDAIPYYLRSLSDPNSWVRHTAMIELKEVEQADLTVEQQALIQSKINDQDERVRATVVHIIGRWNIPEIKEILASALKDTDGRVRANAVESIKSHSLTQQFIKELEPLLNDKSNRVKANAAMILMPFNPTLSQSVARSMIASADVLTRSSGAWLFGVIQPPDAGALLLDRLLNETEEIVINQLVRSLAKLAKNQIPLNQMITGAFGLSSTPAAV
jgi:putative ABC transport system ATP-binding protein